MKQRDTEVQSALAILTGCAGTGKTERLLGEYRAALDQARLARRPGTILWLAPTRRIQMEMLRRIAGNETACFVPNVLTFDLFAEKILESAGRPASPVSPVMRRLLLRRTIESLNARNELRHFQTVVGTSGFLDVVSRFISELKREEIWPEKFVAVCQQRKSAFARRDLELGLIYTEYQKQLAEQNWYDNEGRFWLARTAIAEGIRRPFETVTKLVVDGFTDFTQTQYEILGYLAGWIEQIAISLPGEHPLTRPDLFAKPQSAILRIQKQLPKNVGFRIERISSSEGVPSENRDYTKTMKVISEHLFSNPRFVQKSAEASGLEIIAATGQLGEWEAVARRIKALLSRSTERSNSSQLASSEADTVQPQEIVIGIRSISDEEGPRLRDYLRSAGLPVWCEAESRLNSSSIVKAVIALFTLESENWPFDRLLAVLDSNYFQPQWPEYKEGVAVRAVAGFLRRKQIHVGRDLVLRVVMRHAADETPNSESQARSLRDQARKSAPLLVRLARCLERLRRSHTMLGWADLLAGLSEDLGWTKNGASNLEILTKSDARDLELLQSILRTAAEADQKLVAGDPRLLNLLEFIAELTDLVSHEALLSPKEPGGCIRILSIEQVRNLNVPYLFLVGLTENSFPMNQSEDCLLSDSERKDFISRGIPLRHRSDQHMDEMLLFYSVVTRARRGLTLSFPAVNSKGQQVFPSPYVSAVRDLFEKSAIKLSSEGQLNPVAASDQALTWTDLRLVATKDARLGKPGLFRSLLDIESLRRTCLNTLAACDVADHRFHQLGFTQYEGQLGLARNLTGLQQRFGSSHQFSATELESYARCPFQFWLSNVLRIGAVESPEEGTDHAVRGTLLHEVLAKLLFEGALSDPDRLKTRFVELVDELLDRHLPETGFQKSLIKVERQILSEWADAFALQQAIYDQKMCEALGPMGALPPEIPFGRLPDLSFDDSSDCPPIQFGSGDRKVNLRGRIDRVDVGVSDGRPAYVVIDYKTGYRPSVKKEDLIAGRTIQLGLYLLAIKKLSLIGAEGVPFQMGYWSLRDTGFKHALGGVKLKQIEPAEIQWLETVLDLLLPQLAAEIRSGRFVVENEDPNCTGRCPYRTVCRVNQLRPLAAQLRKQSPGRIDPTEIE